MLLDRQVKKLTAENYYDRDTDYEYMSFSIYKNFMHNPARALADLRNEYPWFKDETPLLVGNFLHSYFESEEAHQVFIDEHQDEIIAKTGKNKGQLKKEYQQANNMIKALERQELFRNMLNGTSREVIVTGEINGVLWKGKIDALNLEKGYFIDFKTIRSLSNPYDWVDGTKQHFIYSREYHLQAAIYQELIKQTFGKTVVPFIWAVDKTDVPAVQLFQPEQGRMAIALDNLKDNQNEVLQIINGEKRPELFDDGSDFYKFNHQIENVEIV